MPLLELIPESNFTEEKLKMEYGANRLEKWKRR